MIVGLFMCSISCCVVFWFILKLFLFLFSQITDARTLFTKLEEKCLLENSSFLFQLLQTICRADLLNLLQADSRQQEETDARPLLSEYRYKQRDLIVRLAYRRDCCSLVHTTLLFVLFRVMLYRIHEGLSREELAKIKFLLQDKLGVRQTEGCKARTKPSFAPHHRNKSILLSNTEKYCSFNLHLIKRQLLCDAEEIFSS